MNRRDFLRQTSALGGAFAAMGLAGDGRAADSAAMPLIKLGNLEVSRLILGTYPFVGFGSPSWLKCKDMYDYYSNHERVFAALDQAAACGVTAAIGAGGGGKADRVCWHDLWQEYKKRGGKLRHWIAECIDKGEQDRPLLHAAAAGAAACYIHAGRVDGLVQARDFDTLRRWLQAARKGGVPLGLAVHNASVLEALDRVNLGQEFYVLCVYRWEGFPPESPEKAFDPKHREKAFETVQKVKRPVIVCKIMADGRNNPPEAFEYAFKRLAPKDGVCVGVYTKDDPDQAQENAALALKYSRPGAG